MSRTYWIAAEDLDSARRRAYAVDAKRLPYLPHYGSEEAAQAWADHINGILSTRIARVFAIVIERRTVDDGVITNVWPLVDRVGSAAAALMMIFGGCWAVAWGTLL